LRSWVPETNALSMLSYGRMIDSKGLKGFPVWSNWPIVPGIVPGISSRPFPALFGVVDQFPIRALYVQVGEEVVSPEGQGKGMSA